VHNKHLDRLKVERRGGLAGLPARGELDMVSLSPADREALDSLFRRKGRLPAAPGADRFRFIVTRETASGTETVELPEHLVPAGIARAVKEELP
jgi:hypothetical protein